MFQLIGTDWMTTTPSANSNEIVIASSRPACKNPLVGPVPEVRGFVSVIPSPSASCKNPVSMISPTNFPLLGSVSDNLYGSIKCSLVEIFIKFPCCVPIESIPYFSAFQLGARIVILTLSVQV